MHSLEPLEQLAVDAFVAALETCHEEGVELPEEVWAIAQSPEQHIEELSEIAKQYPQLNAAYRTARKLLRKAEGHRNKRMEAGGRIFLKQPDLSSELPTQAVDSVHRPDVSDPGDLATTLQTNPTRPIIYRYTLPETASPQAAIAFSKQIEVIRKSNPNWVVSFDRPNPGEADAIILIHKDEHYATNHAAYLMNRTLDQVVGPTLGRIFGAATSKSPKLS